MSSKKLVLVTGSSGFVGSNAVDALLKAGYAVRGTSRPNKADQLRKSNPSPDFQVAIVEDLSNGDISQALKGVYAVVHIASPLPVKPTEFVKVAVDSTLNVLRQVHAAKIKKVVIMSSALGNVTFPEFFDPRVTVTEKDWLKVTYEEATKPGLDIMTSYCASKALAERAAWEFVEANPGISLTTILPPFIYGTVSHSQVIHNPAETLSSNGFLYHLVAGPQAVVPPQVPTQSVDVRDVAYAVVRSLEVEPAPAGQRRRVLVASGAFRFTDAVRHLAVARPELKVRMVDGGVMKDEEPLKVASVDISIARDVLGIKKWIPWQDSVVDAVDSILAREPEWMSKA